jgi:hypothetical protein
MEEKQGEKFGRVPSGRAIRFNLFAEKAKRISATIPHAKARRESVADK